MEFKIFEISETNYITKEIILTGREMSKVYILSYIIENTLRAFIEEKLTNKYGKDYFSKAKISREILKAINVRKAQQNQNSWLPLRGDSDIYFIDFNHLADLITNNWDEFSVFFPDQAWISTKIKELGHCRNLIAHNSLIGNDEKLLFELNSRQILKQIRAITISNYPEKKTWKDDSKESFIEGLKKTSVYSLKQMFEGNEFILDYQEELISPISIRFYFEQSSLYYLAVFNNVRVYISDLINLDLGYASEKEYHEYKEHCKYQLGILDIDEDGIDELFIAVQDPENCSVQINVLKYFPPAFAIHANRKENWTCIGQFKAEHVVGIPQVIVNKRSIRVPRHLRGFYWEWTWVKEEFLYTGNF